MTEFLAQFTSFFRIAEPLILGWFVVFTRVAGMVALLPAFGEQSVPARVKLVVALAFSFIVAPLAPAVEEFGGLLIVTESVIGLIYGLGLRFFILALHMAGTFIAQSISLAQLFGATGEPQPVIGNFLLVTALALAVASGLHIRAAELMIASYDLFPPGQMPDAPDLAQWGITQVARSFALALSLSAPFVIASLVYNTALGIINRAMPQLMVIFIGAPAITLGGMALFAVAAPLLLNIWLSAFETYLADPFGAGG